MERWKFSIFSPKALAVSICFSAISGVAYKPPTGQYPQLMAVSSITRCPFSLNWASFPIPVGSNQRKPKVRESASHILLADLSSTRQTYRCGESRFQSFAFGQFRSMVIVFSPFCKITFFKSLRAIILDGFSFSATVNMSCPFSVFIRVLFTVRIAFTLVYSGWFCI